MWFTIIICGIAIVLSLSFSGRSVAEKSAEKHDKYLYNKFKSYGRR